MKYIISSPSRTGSTIVYNVFRSAQADVVHTHDIFYTIEKPQDTTLIFSLRKDLFASIMSCLVGKRAREAGVRFNQYTENPNISIEPFLINCSLNHLDRGEFLNQYMWHKWYVKSHDLARPFARIEYVYFEDFVNNVNCLYDHFNLTPLLELELPLPCPYRAKHLILNYDQCYEAFEQLEKIDTFIPIRQFYTH